MKRAALIEKNVKQEKEKRKEEEKLGKNVKLRCLFLIAMLMTF